MSKAINGEYAASVARYSRREQQRRERFIARQRQRMAQRRKVAK
jgi:hypothetical protein